MKVPNGHFVNIMSCGSEVTKNDENHSTNSLGDPLDGLGNETKETKCYRLNDIVFAEPLNLQERGETLSQTGNNDETEEIQFIDNVMVQKQSGKRYKKYHINIENQMKPTCPQPNCSKEFSSTTLLKAHIRKVHCADRKYMCSRCGAAHAAAYLLKRHLLMHADSKETCPVCRKTLSLRTNLTVHLRTHTNTRPHKCAVCYKSFVRKATLNLHQKFVHRSGDVECEKCHAKFKSRAEWSRHKSSHRTQ
uniref:C2H2-type domain-containing protein n=2 Tax=Pectinophora gossypiella TaxID=13191 RepID=A0A1E1WPV7_PECGO